MFQVLFTFDGRIIQKASTHSMNASHAFVQRMKRLHSVLLDVILPLPQRFRDLVKTHEVHYFDLEIHNFNNPNLQTW